MDKKDKRILDQIAQTLYDKKGFNVLVLDVSAFSTMANTYIIAEGNVERHVKALANELINTMTEQGRHLYQMDSASPDWVVLDFGDIVIHLMIPEIRDRYALEELWRKASIIDVNIEVPPKKE